MPARRLMTIAKQGRGELRSRSGPPDELAEVVRSTETAMAGLLDTGYEIRAADGGGDHLRTITGHAAVFDRLSQDLGFGDWSFRERVKRGAFRKSLDDGEDVILVVEHDPGRIMGRVGAGTLELSEDPRGLAIRSDVDTRQSYTADLVVAMGRGDVNGASFRFETIEDEWFERRNEDGTTEVIRDLVSVRLIDVSPVTLPAYLDAAVELRGLDIAGVLAPLGLEQIEDAIDIAQRVHGGRVDATAEQRAAIDAAFSLLDMVSPWMEQRAVGAGADEPDQQGSTSGDGDEDGEDTAARERLEAHRAALAKITNG